MAENDLLGSFLDLIGRGKGESTFPPPLTRKPSIQLQTVGIPPSASQYVTEKSAIRFQAHHHLADVEVTFSYRILLPNGDVKGFTKTLTTTGGYVRDEVEEILPECILLNGNISSPDTTGRGLLFARIVITGGSVLDNAPLWTLAQGYVWASQDVTFPGGMVQDPNTGPGIQLNFTQTPPAAGTDFSITLPNAGYIELVYFNVNLISSATLATRSMFLDFSESGTLFTRFSPFVDQGAGVTYRYRWASQGYAPGYHNDNIFSLIPPGFRLPPSSVIASTTSNLQAGDQYTAIRYTLEIKSV